MNLKHNKNLAYINSNLNKTLQKTERIIVQNRTRLRNKVDV